MSAPTVAARSVQIDALDGGAIWHVRLATPKANVLDREKLALLSDCFVRAGGAPDLKAVVLDSDGPHFSFGASVVEHLPPHYDAMLRAFHGLFDRMLESAVVTLAVVRGQCLGGGMELASFAHRLFASPEARFSQPEIVLGVFAPVASVALVERVGRGRAEDLCLSGRAIDAGEAWRIGLVDVLDHDPLATALAYAREHLLPRSASSLRLAARALRAGMAERLGHELATVERLYRTELMATHDANEGLTAFLEKRPPVWRNR